MPRRPSLLLTVATVIFVALSGGVLIFLARVVSQVTRDIEEHPYADGFGMLAAVAWLVMLSWIPLVALVLWTVWKDRRTAALKATGTSMEAIATATGGWAPLIGWTGWKVLRVVALFAGALILVKMLAGNSALSSTPVVLVQYAVFALWTVTAVEVLVRAHLAAA